MTTSTTAIEPTSLLLGLAHCSFCRQPLIQTADDYSCPTLQNNQEPSCPTKPINATRAAMLVLDQFIDDNMTQAALRHIVQGIHDTFIEERNSIHLKIDQIRAETNEIQAEIDAIRYHHQERNEPALHAAMEQMRSRLLKNEATKLHSTLAELDFIMDPDGIRETAMQHKTYLSPHYPEDIKELFELCIADVSFNGDHIHVEYHLLMLGQDDAQES